MARFSSGRAGILPSCLALIGFLQAASGMPSQAAIMTSVTGVPAGTVAFDSAVSAAGGSVSIDVWAGLGGGTSSDRGDYVLSRTNGAALFGEAYGTLPGLVIDISPDGGFDGPNGTPASGLTFSFETPVTAVGFAVADWGTCCFNPNSALFLSIDDGLPILVATASAEADGLFANAAGELVSELFIAAFSDAGGFSSVKVWGDGSGEALYAGSALRYALFAPGEVPVAVPLPAGGVLMLAALAALGAVRRRTR